MPVRIACPKCAAALALPDTMKGKAVKITCKKCGTAFTAGKTATGAKPDEAGTKPVPAKTSEAIRPAKKTAGGPPPRGGADDAFAFDSGDAPRTRRPATRRRGGPNWLLIGGIAGVLAIAVGVGLLFVLRGPSEEEKALAELEAMAKQFKGKLPDGIDPKLLDPTKLDPTKLDPTKLDPTKLDPTKIDPTKIFNPPDKKPVPPEKKGDPPVGPVEKKDPPAKDPTDPPTKDPPTKDPPAKEPPAKDPEPKEPPPPKEPITLKLDGGVRHLTLSPDAKLIALAWTKGYENGIDVYEWPDLKPKQKWKFEVRGTRGLAFAADNKTIYALHSDFFNGLVNGFDAQSGKELGQLNPTKRAMDFVIASPDNKLIVAGNRYEIKAWSTANIKDMKAFAPSGSDKVNEVEDVRFTPDGKLMFAIKVNQGGSQIRVLDLGSGAESMLVKDVPGNFRQLAVTRDGGKIVVVSENSQQTGDVRCYDRDGKELWVWTRPNAQAVMWTISLSPDEKHLALAGNSSSIRILDMADGKTLGGLKNAEFQVRRLAFHSDGKLISGDGDALRIWDLAEMRPVDVPKDPVVVKKETPVKEPPKPPETLEYKGAIVKHFDHQSCAFEVDRKPVRIERLKETAWLDESGAKLPDESPRLRLFANEGNVVDLKVRSEGGRWFLLQVKLVKAISAVPNHPGNFEIKAAKVKQFGGNRAILTDGAGKEHLALIHALGICYDKTGTALEGVNSARIFKANNIVDIWLYPEPGRDFNHVNVARLVSGELMNDAELKAPAPEVAKAEKLTGKLRVKDAGGKKEYSLSIVTKKGKKVVSATHRNLVIDGDPKAFDMTGNPVPWASIFHDNNEIEVAMDTRGVYSTVKEAKLISGIAK